MSSDEAMAVKARAMFGKRLKDADYQNLLQKKSIPELATALQDYPLYQEVLEGINEKSIHRGQLESLIRMDSYERLKKLAIYGGMDDKKFFNITVLPVETKLVLTCIRGFLLNDEEIRNDMIARIPLYLDEYFSFDIAKLAKVNNFDDLQLLLKNTRYEPIIRKYRADSIEDIDSIALEHEMNLSDYTKILDLIEKYGSGAAKEQMLTIINARIELNNIALIYRMKKYFNVEPERIEALIINHYCMFTPTEMHRMIKESDADEVIEELKKKYHRFDHGVEFNDIEFYTGTIRYHLNYHFIEFYTEPSLVLLSYMILSEIELQNVINIIEGVRYQVDTDHIKAQLVY